MAPYIIFGRYFGFSLVRWHSHVFSNLRCLSSKTPVNARWGSSTHSAVNFSPFNGRSPKTMDFYGPFYKTILKRRFRILNFRSNSYNKVLSISTTQTNSKSIKDIEQFLNSKGIPYEHGHTSIVVGCFSCKEKVGTAEKTLYINKTTGSYFCKSCGRSGPWGQLKNSSLERSGHVPASDLNDQEFNQLRATSISNNSKQTACEIWNTSELLQTNNASNNQVQEIFDLKKITDASLLKYQVHLVEYKFSDSSGHSSYHPCIVFPWFGFSKSSIHGVKLVRIEKDDNEAVALQPRYGTLGLFGWNTVPDGAKEVVLTLNEFDAIAVHQETSYPAISLPLGTHSLPVEVLPHMEQFERIILWFGEDVRARQAANQFSKKLNIQRCHIVRSPDDNPPSGPLDALNKGFDLKKLIKSSKSIRHDKIATFQELRNDVYSELVNADQVAGVKWSRFPKLNSLLKGHRRGELTIFTGPTGAGKTTLLSEMSIDLCQQGVNTLWGSFEIRNVRLAKIMMNQLSGIDLQKNIEKFSYWADKFEMLPMYFMSFYGSQHIDAVIETMAHAVYVFDIDHVIIDNLQFMTSAVRAEDRFSVQNHAISCFRHFASSKNVHVTLVIHPRKENDDVELQTASIFGTAKASQEADNVLILQVKRGRGDIFLQVSKNRFNGNVGRIPLDFVKSSLSMSGYGKKDSRQQETFKEPKVMTNFPNAIPIQNNNVSAPSPRKSQRNKKNSEEEKNNDMSKQSVEVSKVDQAIQGKTKLDLSSGDLEGVRIFQDKVSQQIKSHNEVKRQTASSTGKGNDNGNDKGSSNGNAQKLKGKKLSSKTVASLIAKPNSKNIL